MLIAFALAIAAQTSSPSTNEKRIIEGLIKYDLKDPGSAKFRYLPYRRAESGHVYCGYVNAKNSFGGYTGFRMFHVTFIYSKAKLVTGVAFVDDGKGYIQQMCLEDGALQ